MAMGKTPTVLDGSLATRETFSLSSLRILSFYVNMYRNRYSGCVHIRYVGSNSDVLLIENGPRRRGM